MVHVVDTYKGYIWEWDELKVLCYLVVTSLDARRKLLAIGASYRRPCVRAILGTFVLPVRTVLLRSSRLRGTFLGKPSYVASGRSNRPGPRQSEGRARCDGKARPEVRRAGRRRKEKHPDLARYCTSCSGPVHLPGGHSWVCQVATSLEGRAKCAGRSSARPESRRGGSLRGLDHSAALSIRPFGRPIIALDEQNLAFSRKGTYASSGA
jgi:hypothetical protein